MLYHTRDALTLTLPGTCLLCGVAHDPEQPHSLKSLFFQYAFYDEHGYAPTMEDAMAHCSEDVKKTFYASQKAEVSDNGQAHGNTQSRTKRNGHRTRSADSAGQAGDGVCKVPGIEGQQHITSMRQEEVVRDEYY